MGASRFNPSGLVSIITLQTRLERLKISLLKLGDSVLRSVACHGNQIKLLCLDNIYGLSAVDYSWMGEARDLQILHLAYCMVMGDGCIKNSPPFSYASLKKVTIKSCSSFRDALGKFHRLHLPRPRACFKKLQPYTQGTEACEVQLL
ncbi:EIN3-binding F-box protein 1-like [Canna indica]|uniref:EIN3-binding F-box protein 1-like n=1 Tax=Canna indica TaxID=4628 RepID=A0AAQ3K8A1_9LILI|nr:EIN3-binding F-box protein 1-like [Canna indica]